MQSWVNAVSDGAFYAPLRLRCLYLPTVKQRWIDDYSPLNANASQAKVCLKTNNQILGNTPRNYFDNAE